MGAAQSGEIVGGKRAPHHLPPDAAFTQTRDAVRLQRQRSNTNNNIIYNNTYGNTYNSNNNNNNTYNNTNSIMPQTLSYNPNASASHSYGAIFDINYGSEMIIPSQQQIQPIQQSQQRQLYLQRNQILISPLSSQVIMYDESCSNSGGGEIHPYGLMFDNVYNTSGVLNSGNMQASCNDMKNIFNEEVNDNDRQMPKLKRRVSFVGGAAVETHVNNNNNNIFPVRPPLSGILRKTSSFKPRKKSGTNDIDSKTETSHFGTKNEINIFDTKSETNTFVSKKEINENDTKTETNTFDSQNKTNPFISQTRPLSPVHSLDPEETIISLENVRLEEHVKEEEKSSIKEQETVRRNEPITQRNNKENKRVKEEENIVKIKAEKGREQKQEIKTQENKSDNLTSVRRLSCQYRVRTLVLMQELPNKNLQNKKKTSILQVNDNNLSIVGKEDNKLTVDEVLLKWDTSSPVQSKELDQVKDIFTSGYCASVICVEGSEFIKETSISELSSWSVLKQVADAVVEKVSIQAKDESKQIQLACAFAAINGKKISDLLQKQSKFETLSVRPSPLFGMRIVGLEYRNIPDITKFNMTIADAVSNVSSEEDSKAEYLVLSFLLNSRLLANANSDGDVVVSSLLLIAAGEGISNLQRVLDKSSNTPQALFDECVNGSCHTVSVYISHEEDIQAEAGIKLQKRFMEARHAAARFGSARSLIHTLDEAIERAQGRLGNICNKEEKKNTEKYIENRMVLKASLNELLQVVRPSGS